ncbi:uncharacterized protein BN654_00326 [Clostridium sp. CAG:433]|jgi:hypothetical protein|nr:MAG: hypothetical protein BHW07_02995 [Clostridium sp. CAG_433_25_7]CDD28163.1 uncharacterized protein BN654_00326 [Clostridium sp. CAG:433]
MSNKEEFKLFVKSHPELIRYVKDGEMTWQKFYETYSLYGKENDVWNKYFSSNEEIKENTNEKKDSVSLTDVIDMVKKVDLNSVQKNITNISKALGIVQSLITKDEVNTTESYTPRPLYKKFED